MIKNDSSILIVLLGAIGDVIRAFPLVTHLKNNLPDSEITWAVESPSVDIVRAHPAVSHVVEFKRKGGLSSYFSFIKELRSKKYEIVLDLQRHFKSGITSYLSNGERRIGFNFSNSREFNFLFQTETINKVDFFSDKIYQYFEFSKQLGINNPDKLDYSLTPSKEDILELESKLDNLIKENKKYYQEIGGNLPPERRVLFFIGSTWESREWSPEYYAELADELYKNFGLISILIGAGRDRINGNKILNLVKVPIIDLINKTTLTDFKNLCFRSRLGVGSDSGPLHIASGAGLQCVSFWGATSPTRSKPYKNLENSLKSPIGCSPCYQSSCSGVGNTCLKGITPKVTLYKIKEILEAKNITS